MYEPYVVHTGLKMILAKYPAHSGSHNSIEADVLDLFQAPGVVLLAAVIEAPVDSEEAQETSAYGCGGGDKYDRDILNTLFSLHLLHRYGATVAHKRSLLHVQWACMTDLGIRLIERCDRDLYQRLVAAEEV